MYTSLLGILINDINKQALTVWGPTLIKNYINTFNAIGGEVGATIEDFKCYVCAEDYFPGKKYEVDLWEMACKLAECDKDFVAEQIGLVLDFTSATECILRFSKK